jgi:hypothetical protein
MSSVEVGGVRVPVQKPPPPWIATLAKIGLGTSLLGGILLFVDFGGIIPFLEIKFGMLLWAGGILLQVIAGAFAYFKWAE